MDKDYEKVLLLFEPWLKKSMAENEIREELQALQDKLNTEKKQEALDEIYEAFYKDLEFGTGGLRGILGAGTNRMNIYSVGKATQGLADYIKVHYSKDPSIAISYDSRINSKLFAEVAAEIMSENGIEVYLYPRLSPTPMLSYAVRYFKASAGIMVTASHNPAKYNGYKVYNHEGCQMTIEAADEVLRYIEKIDPFEGVKRSVRSAEPLQGIAQSETIAALGQSLEKSVASTVSVEGLAENDAITVPVQVQAQSEATTTAGQILGETQEIAAPGQTLDKSEAPATPNQSLDKSEAIAELAHTIDKSSTIAASIHMIEKSVEDEYIKEVLKAGVPTDCSVLEVVYTPLNGSGLKPVTRILSEIGVGKVHIVKSQEEPDGNFPTCPFPNPEKREALEEGLKLCEELKTPDLLLATDPDCDRIGIAVRTENQGGVQDKFPSENQGGVQDKFPSENQGGIEYKLLSGNEVGALLLDFLCKEKKRPDQPIVVKTIVTSNMAKDICVEYGMEIREVLTGFKFIGEIIGRLEQEGQEKRFFFGFEESYGYLSGPYVRDKDAVNAAMLIAQMASYYKMQKQTLWDRLLQLYEKYGYYVDAVAEFAFEGAAGMQAMARIMDALRAEAPSAFAGSPVASFVDYMKEDTGLPKSEVLSYTMQNGAGLIARPSGTEPKLKVYLSAKEAQKSQSLAVIENMKTEISALIKRYSS